MNTLGWTKAILDIDEEIDQGINMEVLLKLSPGVVSVDIVRGKENIGYMELSIEECPINEGDQLVEIRNIEIIEEHRGKGYTRGIIDKIKTVGLPITGCVTEEDYDILSKYWEHMGAEFINDTDFIIK